MSNQRVGNITFENPRILFRNFSGKETRFNRAGNRNFCVIIDDPDQAHAMKRDGWNVRTLTPRDENESERYYIQVAVNFENIPPKIVLITQRNRTVLTEATVDSLDYAEIRNVDLIIRPYNWEVSGKSGIKAYLKTMYVTIEEDILDEKYADGECPWDE